MFKFKRALISGTKKDDVLAGTDRMDILLGKKGNDVLDGGAGNDWLFGGKGNDKLLGGDGKDFLFGDKGKDSLFGGAGNDFLSGGKGNDFLDGGAGSDWLFGGKGNDVLSYSMSGNLGPAFTNIGARDYYDGGKGFDTLKLALTSGELLLDSVQRDLAAFKAFLTANVKIHGDKGPDFHFSSFDLTARNIEALEYELVNAAPTAQVDIVSTDEDTPLEIAASGLLANDTDPDHLDVLAVTGADATSTLGATVRVGLDGSLTYDPTVALALQQLAQDATATDSFSYTISDLAGATTTGTVNVEVTGVNDAPVAGDDEGSTNEDTLLNGTVFANDSDVDTGDAFSVSSVNGRSGDVGTVITLASGALLTVNANGSYSYDPNGKFESLAVGQEDTYSFNYVIADSHGATSDIATVALTITGVNDAPVAMDDEIEGTGGSAGPIRVAVVGGSQILVPGNNAAEQLADNFDFDVTAILVNLNTTKDEWVSLLADYDVVVVGENGFTSDYAGSQLFAALRDFIDAGHGVVTTGVFAGKIESYLDQTTRDDADYISPAAINPAGTGSQFAALGTNITISRPFLPITGDLESYAQQGRHEVAAAVDDIDKVLAVDSLGRAAIAYDEVGAGRSVFLGAVHMATGGFPYNSEETRSGTIDQIFERAVAWAAGDRSGTGAATNEDTALVIGSALLLENDTDIDNGDVLSIFSVWEYSQLGAAVSYDAESGKVTYDPRASAELQALNSGQIATDSFDYTISDGNGGFATASVSLTVAGITDTLI
jgi:large repetitive protein